MRRLGLNAGVGGWTSGDRLPIDRHLPGVFAGRRGSA